MTESWTVIDEATGSEEGNLLDAEIIDAVNRFARQATLKFIDVDGSVADKYEKANPMRIEIDGTTRFGGFVTDISRREDKTILKLYSHDLWLRRRDVLRGYTDQTISYILEDLITSLTSLTWDASQVNVVNDKTISRTWKGENLSEVIEELASISANETFGADNDATFFFEARDATSAPIGIHQNRYFEAEFENKGKREVNQVEVFYDEGSDRASVIVSDLEAQEELADKLGRPRPVVIEMTSNYPEIENEDAARRKGQKLLRGKTGILRGQVITWGGFDVNPNDIIFVNVPEEGIKDEFRVAEIAYRYVSGETRLKLARNQEGVIDTLVSMSEEVTRIDLRNADETVSPTYFLTNQNPLDIEVSLTAYKINVPDKQMLWGYPKGGWGHPDATGSSETGGGYWGDQRGARVEIDSTSPEIYSS